MIFPSSFSRINRHLPSGRKHRPTSMLVLSIDHTEPQAPTSLVVDGEGLMTSARLAWTIDKPMTKAASPRANRFIFLYCGLIRILLSLWLCTIEHFIQGQACL